jgi:hypothetical protein
LRFYEKKLKKAFSNLQSFGKLPVWGAYFTLLYYVVFEIGLFIFLFAFLNPQTLPKLVTKSNM